MNLQNNYCRSWSKCLHAHTHIYTETYGLRSLHVSLSNCEEQFVVFSSFVHVLDHVDMNEVSKFYFS